MSNLAGRIPLTEHQIQKQIMDECEIRRIFYWRNNSGAVKYEYKGKTRFVNFGGCPGSSDLMGFYQGQFWAAEVKSGDEFVYLTNNIVRIRARVLSQKKKDFHLLEQIEFIDRVNREGGHGFFVSSVQQFMDEIKKCGDLKGTPIERGQ